jgi:hypothetical protein
MWIENTIVVSPTSPGLGLRRLRQFSTRPRFAHGR